MTVPASRPALAFGALLLLHDPIITLTGSAIVAHGLLGLALLWFSSMLVLSVRRSGVLVWSGGLTTLLALVPVVALGLLYCLLDPGDFNVRIQFLATFLLAPLIWGSFSRLAADERGREAVSRLLLLYVVCELGIMLLQISYFLLGVGIAPNETYGSMIPGSQFNGNNLASIVVTLSIFYNLVSEDRPRWQRWTFNLVVVLILLVTFSRLAVVLYVADRARSLSLRRIPAMLAVAAGLLAAGVMVGDVDKTGNETIDSTLYKAQSLATIASVGFEADTSTSSRGESYSNFLGKLDTLGLGSAEILNYARFTSDAVFADETLYVDPHSMLIEFGYWMGWPGLAALALFLALAYARQSQGSLLQRAFIISAVLLATSIPSSAIPLPALWVGMLLLAMIGSYRPQKRFRSV